MPHPLFRLEKKRVEIRKEKLIPNILVKYYSDSNFFILMTFVMRGTV